MFDSIKFCNLHLIKKYLFQLSFKNVHNILLVLEKKSRNYSYNFIHSLVSFLSFLTISPTRNLPILLLFYRTFCFVTLSMSFWIFRSIFSSKIIHVTHICVFSSFSSPLPFCFRSKAFYLGEGNYRKRICSPLIYFRHYPDYSCRNR